MLSANKKRLSLEGGGGRARRHLRDAAHGGRHGLRGLQGLEQGGRRGIRQSKGNELDRERRIKLSKMERLINAKFPWPEMRMAIDKMQPSKTILRSVIDW